MFIFEFFANLIEKHSEKAAPSANQTSISIQFHFQYGRFGIHFPLVVNSEICTFWPFWSDLCPLHGRTLFYLHMLPFLFGLKIDNGTLKSYLCSFSFAKKLESIKRRKRHEWFVRTFLLFVNGVESSSSYVKGRMRLIRCSCMCLRVGKRWRLVMSIVLKFFLRTVKISNWIWNGEDDEWCRNKLNSIATKSHFPCASVVHLRDVNIEL